MCPAILKLKTLTVKWPSNLKVLDQHYIKKLPIDSRIQVSDRKKWRSSFSAEKVERKNSPAIFELKTPRIHRIISGKMCFSFA